MSINDKRQRRLNKLLEQVWTAYLETDDARIRTSHYLHCTRKEFIEWYSKQVFSKFSIPSPTAVLALWNNER